MPGGMAHSGVRSVPVAVRNSTSSCVTSVCSGAPSFFQSGSSSVRDSGSMTAPARIWAPTSAPFSSTQTLISWFFSAASCLSRMAVARPAGPAPTITTSNSIESRSISTTDSSRSMEASFEGGMVGCARTIPGSVSEGPGPRPVASRHMRHRHQSPSGESSRYPRHFRRSHAAAQTGKAPRSTIVHFCVMGTLPWWPAGAGAAT